MKTKGAPLTRSEVMSRVKSRDTRPEMRLRKALHAAGLRYRLQGKELPGRPDIIFRPAKVAMFVHGCFWHRHPGCEHARMPKSRIEFWREKFASNVERDARQISELEAAGWTVVVLWECATRNPTRLAEAVSRVAELVRNARNE